MAKRKSNPEHNSTMLLVVGGAAAIAYYGYTQGWFTNTNIVGTVTPPLPNPSFPSNPISNGATIVNTPDPSIKLKAQISAMITANPNDSSIYPMIQQLQAMDAPSAASLTYAWQVAQANSPSGKAALSQSGANQLAMDMANIQAQNPTWSSDQVATAAQQLQATQIANQKARQAAAYGVNTGVSGLRGLSGGAWG